MFVWSQLPCLPTLHIALNTVQDMNVHVHVLTPFAYTHAHTCVHIYVLPLAQETSRGPSSMGFRVQPQGLGACDSGPQEGAVWTFGTPIEETLRQEGEARA